MGGLRVPWCGPVPAEVWVRSSRLFGEVEGILHVPCRMILRDVQLLRCTDPLHLRAVDHIEAHRLEDIDHVLKHRVQRMKPRRWPGRLLGMVTSSFSFRSRLAFERVLNFRFPLGQCCFQLAAQLVDQLTDLRASSAGRRLCRAVRCPFAHDAMEFFHVLRQAQAFPAHAAGPPVLPSMICPPFLPPFGGVVSPVLPAEKREIKISVPKGEEDFHAPGGYHAYRRITPPALLRPITGPAVAAYCR